MSFLGDLGTDALVLKFSTLWYIYFTCLKLLQIRKYVKNSMYAYFLGIFACFLVFLYGFGNIYDSSHVYHHIRTM